MRVNSWLGLAALAASACGSPSVRDEAPWQTAVALEGVGKIGGCAVGDLDPASPGEEIAAVCESGDVWMLAYDDGEWRRELVLEAAGELIQCAIGDVDADHEGEELVVIGRLLGGEDAGTGGAAYLCSRSAEGWRTEILHEEEDLLHAVAIADLAPLPGEEVLVAGFTRRASLLAKGGARGFRLLAEAELPGNAKGAAAAPERIVVACDDGSLVSLVPAGDALERRVLARFPSALARVSVDGGEILLAANDGVLRRLVGERTEEVFHSSDRLRGAVLAELDLRGEGLELATAGYDGRLTVLRREGPGWVAEHVATDDNRFHHLASGSIGRLGPALVGCGYSGRVLVVHR